jgi:hypothetical protein
MARDGTDVDPSSEVRVQGEGRPSSALIAGPEVTRRLAWYVPACLRALVPTASVVVAMTLYPVLFMGGTLRPSSPYHLRNAFADPNLLTDFDGGVRLAQIIQHMDWPWSLSQLSAAPTGESILRWQTATQGIQFGALFVFTRIFPPAFSMNLIVLIGWVLTGLAAYGLARRLGAGVAAALCAGLVAQMLPSMPTMAANYTSYVYIAVPIWVVSRTLDLTTNPTNRNLLWLFAALGVTVFFDPYWFFFSLVIVAVGVLIRWRAMCSWYVGNSMWAKVGVAVAVISPILLIALVVLIDRLAGDEAMSRPLGVAATGLVAAGLRSPLDWFRSSFEGLGVLVGPLAFVGAMYTLVRRGDERRTVAAAIALVLVLLSTRTRFETPLGSIGSLAEYVRFFMPGVRFFQRAALIAEVMACVAASVLIAELVKRMTWRWLGALLATAALFTAAVDLDPPSHRSFQRRWDDFGAFREVVWQAPNPVVAAVPFDRAGRSWFELGMLGPVRSINPLYSSERAAETALMASRGPESLAAYLSSLGVTHMLVAEGEQGYPIAYQLEPPRFIRRGAIELNNYEFDPQPVILYELRAQPGDRFCAGCAVGGEYEFIEDVVVRGDVGSLEADNSVGTRWWWITGEDSTFDIELADLGVAYEVEVELVLGNAPCATPRSISVAAGDKVQLVSLRGSENPVIRVPVMSADDGGVVTVNVEGTPCRIEGDDRDLMVQVFFPSIP